MNNFFDVDSFRGNVSKSGGRAQADIYEEEVQSIVDEYNAKMEFCKVYADVEAYDEEYVSIYGGASVTFMFEIKTKEIDLELIEEYVDKRGEYNSLEQETFARKVCEEMKMSTEDPHIETTFEGGILKITINSYKEELNNPDDFSSFAYEVSRFENNKYEELKTEFYNFLSTRGYVPMLSEYTKTKLDEMEDLSLFNIELTSKDNNKVSFSADPYIVYYGQLQFNEWNSAQLAADEIRQLVINKLHIIYNDKKRQQSLFVDKEGLEQIEPIFNPKALLLKNEDTITLHVYFDFVYLSSLRREELNSIKIMISFFDKYYEDIMESIKPQVNEIIKRHVGKVPEPVQPIQKMKEPEWVPNVHNVPEVSEVPVQAEQIQRPNTMNTQEQVVSKTNWYQRAKIIQSEKINKFKKN